MSVQAVTWAIEQQIVKDAPARHVLLCLANYADHIGSAAFPSTKTLSNNTGLSERTVRTKLDLLERTGVIARGNQAIVAAYIERADRRPICYQLSMSRPACPAPRGPERGVADDITGCSSCSNGVQLTQVRGARPAANPSYKPSLEPSKNTLPSPAAPAKRVPSKKQGLEYPDEFLSFWEAYPRKQGKGAALNRWRGALDMIGGTRAEAAAKILKGVRRYVKAIADERIEPDKIKMAEGWLNAGRWDDEYSSPVAVNRDAPPLDWWTLASGVDAKAKQLGLVRACDENPAEFRLRVLVKAGSGPWQLAELARAERDNATAYAARLRQMFGFAEPAALALPIATPRAAPAVSLRETLAACKRPEP